MNLKLFAAASALLAFAACTTAVTDEDPADGSYTLTQARSTKRGVSFNFESNAAEDIALLGPSVCWSYNWGNTAPSTATDDLFGIYQMDWCPMAWNNSYNADAIRAYKAAHPEAQYILGFNEPNLTDQCNMTPQQAAKYWPALVALARELDMKLIAPAMNYGTLSGYSDPWKWLDEFFAIEGCGLDTVDGIAIHCYMGATSALASYLEKFTKYGKPIWLTEFCDWDADEISATRQRNFMVETVNYLESNPDVFRYAWFIPRGNYNYKTNYNLLDGMHPAALTNLGTVFCNMSTWDGSIVYKPRKTIPAEQYASCSGSVHLQPSQNGGVLDLCDFKAGCSVSYNIEVPSKGDYTVVVRYMSEKPGAGLRLSSSEGASAECELLPGFWGPAEMTLELPAGKSVLTLEGVGTVPSYINWLRIK